MKDVTLANYIMEKKNALIAYIIIILMKKNVYPVHLKVVKIVIF